ncbi:hypothetical protein KUV35_19095 [Marinobacter salsuginis]|uniref:hypothetical protein n=1 Tax=Marinobacter salsuginis TaxID=418719 RepID=UPI001C95890C|nr:hypothetical protein [Marinobacter salsuginis]MBY6073415.1 hypothetical protein [Marinobacter salsuginis]
MCNESPAKNIHKKLRKIDNITAPAGLGSYIENSARDPKKREPSFLESLLESLSNVQLTKLTTNYPEITDIAAEIVATIEEDSYFDDLEKPSMPKLNHDKKQNIREIVSYASKVRALIEPLIIEENANLESKKFYDLINKKKADLEKGFYYEFTNGDLKRIQEILNELRDKISTSELFGGNHKTRLLRRLERLQAELHKRMSDLDRFWGLVGDAGVVLGKFGNDAKPFVDRIKEISDIVFRTQARAEELPSAATNPLLEKK